MPGPLAGLDLTAAWAGAIFLLIGFAGGLFLVNVFVPSGVILAASSTLIGGGVLPWTAAVWARMGVILGCSTSYAIGRALGPRFRNSRFAANRRDLLARAEGLFARFGALALFVAYFSGPMRGAVPFAAGLAPLPFLRFQAINVASAAAWIGATMSPGALLWRMSV